MAILVKSLCYGDGDGTGDGAARSRTRSSWLNCALRDDEAAYWVSIGHFEAVADVS